MSCQVKRSNPDALKTIFNRIGEMRKKEIAVGFPAGKVAAYPETGEAVATIAAKHVYGIDVPRRDFMTEAESGIIDDTKETRQAIIEELNKGIPEEQLTPLMEAAGMQGADAIKTAIVDGNYLALAPYTIEKRRENGRPSTKPLIDTAHMVDHVTHVTRDKTL